MERLQSLSPAAQRLVNKSVSRTSTDKSLQASYTPSPRSLPGDKTPILRTTPGRTPGKTPTKTPTRTPKTTPKRTESVSLTDNLLDLPKRNARSKAADFFWPIVVIRYGGSNYLTDWKQSVCICYVTCSHCRTIWTPTIITLLVCPGGGDLFLLRMIF